MIESHILISLVHNGGTILQILKGLYQLGGDMNGLTWAGVDAGYEDAVACAVRKRCSSKRWELTCAVSIVMLSGGAVSARENART